MPARKSEGVYQKEWGVSMAKGTALSAGGSERANQDSFRLIGRCIASRICAVRNRTPTEFCRRDPEGFRGVIKA